MNEPAVSPAQVRRVGPADIDECAAFAMPLFAERFPHMNWDGVRQSAAHWINSPDILVCRTDNAVGAASVKVSLWEPFPIACEEFVAAAPNATPFEALAIYRAMNDWRLSVGAKKFRFGWANGVDIGPIARRLGAHEYQTIYELD